MQTQSNATLIADVVRTMDNDEIVALVLGASKEARAQVEVYVGRVMLGAAAVEPAAGEAPAKPKRARATGKPNNGVEVKPGKVGTLTAKGAKRDPDAIADLAASIAAHVKIHPGQSAEQIGKALGVSTREMGVPFKRLVASGKVTTTGSKRATRYHGVSDSAQAVN